MRTVSEVVSHLEIAVVVVVVVVVVVAAAVELADGTLAAYTAGSVALAAGG